MARSFFLLGLGAGWWALGAGWRKARDDVPF